MSDSIVIRDLRNLEDIRTVEDLQRKIWGMSDLDILPSTMILASIEVGGSLLGAFVDDHLAGFAYSFPGLENGRLTMHSDMLGVDPAFRNHDLGYKLKLAQRDRALKFGIDQITWTFDPLQSLNAYFNIAKLGAVSDKYKPNFYGETSSFLHRLGTDRLWVRWLIQSGRVKQRLNDKEKNQDVDALFGNTKPLVEVESDLSPKTSALAEISQHSLSIEIPRDINSIIKDNLDLALRWRDAVRWAFTTAFEAEYVVRDFVRNERESRQTGVYLLSA